MKYSVITPVYNRADCIARCLDSVIRNLQWGVEIEHVVVDDRSKDDSPNIVREYVKKYSHIKFIPFYQNRGTNAARNAAIQAATGDFCIILDSDDYFVDEAVNVINNIVSKEIYREYMFAADDMVEQYQGNPLLKSDHCIIQYEDFLIGRVSGDFIHVVSSEILKKYPFEEKLRVYEYLFFLRFYRESKEVLFTNKVVTIRERSREDSVTRECIRTEKEHIERQITVSKIFLEWYKDDLLALNAGYVVSQNLRSMFANQVLVGRYADAGVTIDKLREYGSSISKIYLLIYHLRFGAFFRIALQNSLKFKYSVLRKKIK